MKKYKLILSGLLTFVSYLQATDVLLEVKGAYFRPTNHLFREIYGNGGGRYGVELTAQAWKQLYPWVSVDYFTRSGQSIGGCDHTRIHLVPIGVGLKYLVPFQKHYDFYVGLGVLPTYMRIRDSGPCVIPTTKKWGVGGIVKAGFLFNFRNFFLDIFGDYNCTKIRIDNDDDCCVDRMNAKVGGWAVGLGLGYRFR